MGLTADESGLFHPFWTDRRTGTFQVHTASIHVLTTREKVIATHAAELKSTQPSPEIQHNNRNPRFELIFDPTETDQENNAILLPVRVKNNSAQAIQAPLQVEVTYVSSELRFLNALVGPAGDVVTFDYSCKLGDENRLDPGATSGAVLWKIKPSKPLDHFWVPMQHLKMHARIVTNFRGGDSQVDPR
jgi:hypothetical protein